MKISVVINTYNADRFLEKVLESVKDFDEILICDMHSTDRTLEIVSKYNCRVVFHERVGIVEPARSYAISQAKNDWVLVIDADEVVPPRLKDYLQTIVSQYADLGGIKIPRKNYLMGRFMHGAYPNYLLRFIHKEKTVWPSTVHVHPIVSGRIIKIPSNRKDLALIHLANETIKVTTNKTNIYTDFEILREKRIRRKYGLFDLFFEPFLRFLHFYLFKGGFRDGIPGFIWACEYSYYKFVTIAKILELRVQSRDIDKDLKNLD